MKIHDAVSLDDVVAIARKRIPKFAFDYLDSGAGDDRGVRANASAFSSVCFTPRFLRGLKESKICTQVELFGETYDLPFGMAPTGMNQVVWPGADMLIAELAAKANFPVVNSTLATCSVERVASAAPGKTWFQLYLRSEDAVNADLLARAWRAGVRVLVVTIDLPSSPNRNRDARNGFGVSTFKLTPKVAISALRCPSWLRAWVNHPGCSFENLAPYVGEGAGYSVLKRIGTQTKLDASWADIARLRQLWDGALVIKGVLDIGDVRRCVELGADGVWVSNHGGRQLESARPALECLPAIADAVGHSAKVLFDSGVRGGEDVVKALALGADFVFLGRSLLYGAAAGGAAGARRVLDLYARDVARTLTQIGCASVHELSEEWICPSRNEAAHHASVLMPSDQKRSK